MDTNMPHGRSRCQCGGGRRVGTRRPGAKRLRLANESQSFNFWGNSSRNLSTLGATTAWQYPAFGFFAK